MADDETIDDLADGQPGPDKEPKSAKAWLALITEAEKAFKGYQEKADNIDKLFASLEKLASSTRDRQFQLFWANVQVLGPSVYSRPPVPVVVPRFKDRKPIPRLASELLERSTVVTFELEDIDSVMRLIRDDLIRLARGCAWVRYEAKSKDSNFSERVCIEYVDRKDFLHDPARTWKEVDWVDKISYLTKQEMRKRFYKTSGDVYKDAAYEQRKDDHTEDNKLKAKVHEIWSKSQNRVVWVSEGCDKLLDDGEPHLTLDGFFPCPRPVYATTEPRSLKPVPDMVFYKDQLEEINELTARIGALSDAVKVRGFYPAGAGEIGDAIEAAVKSSTDNQILIPIANWAMIGSGGVKDMIVWLPLEMIANTITQLVELRKQLIDDVYQITGLSDIMRGSTVASETLGAQELKSQYGSVRIKDKQAELVRIARDITRIGAEIMAENFQAKSLLEMSQMDIPTSADIAKECAPIKAQLAKVTHDAQTAMQDPETQAMAKQNPEHAQQVMQQVQQQIGQLNQQLQACYGKPTVEQVMALLRDQKMRPFDLDIETDSTIAPDDNANKQRITEYVTAVGGFLGQALPLVQEMPQAAPMVADVLKMAASQFRVGRDIEGSIEEFADTMKQMAAQPKPPNPEAVKAQADAQAAQLKSQSDAQMAQADAAEKQANAQKILIEAKNKAAGDEHGRKLALAEAVDAARARSAEIENKASLGKLQLEQARQKHAQDMDLGVLKLEEQRLKVDALKAPQQSDAAKPPSESINYKDVPPEAQSQMLAQAGIEVSSDTLAAHADEQAAQQAELKKANAPKAKEPA